ncbi:hypothetical protein [Yeosuana sp.]|uniref:hypothetical protein n=1 Tax=Yeosuana sp. TaxID=2529388 RepID=UPI004055093D|tara:strand:- start:825 stop:1271 length:447 start_codon:yes stop_codon:yes gene_type:complete
MKMKIIFVSFSFLFITSISFSQKKTDPVSIIRQGASISKYHQKEDLEKMQKGELLGLYIERIETLVRTLPYIAFATKPGITMSDLGVPNTNENRKILDNEFDATDSFLKDTVEFHEKMLPYSDTKNLIAAILFYEETLKRLHEFSEFN